ncbi:MAG: LysR family transcriptional regulator [Shimia sp.]
MDVTLLRTFLAVAATGTFVGAADRLFVTQSAVSLRIRRLEDAVGQRLFERSKGGAALTPEGRAFEGYALRILGIWEESRQQIGLPEGFTAYLNLGAQYSLWPRLGFRWLDALRAHRPDLSLRAEVGMPDRLTTMLGEGTVQAALLYTPQLRPGLRAERVMDDELVLISGRAGARIETLAGAYAFVDWGREFVQAHARHLPSLTGTGLTLSMGALAGEYVAARGLAAYLPARWAAPGLAAGRLHLVPDAPVFPFPVWALWREDLDADLAEAAAEALHEVAAAGEATTEGIVDDLAALSGGRPEIMDPFLVDREASDP